MLIVFYNTIWDQPMDLPRAESLPGGCQMSLDRSLLPAADAVVFHLPSLPVELFTSLAQTRPPKQRWVAWSMECERHYPQMADPAFMRHFALTMTYRLDSDIPVPYLPPDFSTSLQQGSQLYEARSGIKPEAVANAFISSSYDLSGRSALLKELMELMPIDSYGRLCRTIPASAEDDGPAFKLKTMARYPFTLAFENACSHDYVTEKFFQPLLVGSVPVVLGAPNVDELAPGDHCFINVRDFESSAALASHLLQLASDQALYQHYQAWRHRPLRRGFLDLEQKLRQPALVRLGEALLAQAPPP